MTPDQILFETADQIERCIDLSFLKEKRVFITGATGLIGSMLVRTLLQGSKRQKIPLSLCLLVRNPQKAEALFADLPAFRSSVTIFQGDVLDPFPPFPAEFVVHCAAPTSSQFMQNAPVDTFQTIVGGTQNFLSYLQQNPALQSAVFLSSLEVYGTPSPQQSRMIETENGILDCTRPRSSYPEGKRAAECLCAAYASQYDLPVSIARLAQTFGPGVPSSDNRVFSQFARNITQNKNIELHTEGRTSRNYCDLRDAVSAILLLLEKGISGEAYNVATPETYCSIREFAEKMLAVSNSNCSIHVNKSAGTGMGYAPELKIELDISKLCALGFTPSGSLCEMLKSLLNWFSTIHNAQKDG